MASVAPGRYHDDLPRGARRVTLPEDGRTAREHLGWQLRTTRVLADLLTLAMREALPRIAWTVGSVGANLAGHCYGRTGSDRSHEFQMWCAAIGATLCPQFTDSSGVTHLRTTATCYDGLVDIVVLADVYPDDENEDEHRPKALTTPPSDQSSAARKRHAAFNAPDSRLRGTA